MLPCTRLAAHYLVAGTELAAGGDWFDAVPLPDDRLALLIGDVVGHGAAAAAAMGQLRAIAVQALRDGADAVSTVERLVGSRARWRVRAAPR